MDEKLKKDFKAHLEETKENKLRLEEICESIGTSKRRNLQSHERIN
ncbi:DUF892 family protein [Flavobacterium sp. XN-5]|nr:DUF892 family protein [Flavobacterium sp. XN-5]